MFLQSSRIVSHVIHKKIFIQAFVPSLLFSKLCCISKYISRWVFSNYRNFKPSRRHPIISGFSIFELRGKSCESRKLNWRFLQLHSLRHVGSSETSVRSMSLYKRNSFFGSELLLTGSGLSLPLPLEFNSLAFTGGKAWALFPVSNFIGNFTCVGPPKGNSLIWNNPNISLTVGSIYFKCPKIKNFTLPISTDYLILYKNSSEGRGRNESRADEGIPSLFFDGKEIRLPVAEIFVEFSIAGSEKWTIYSGLDFNGKSRCLVKFGQKRLGNDEIRRFRFKRSNTGQRIGSEAENDSPDFGETWLIGSIRYGCFSSSSTQHEEDYEDQLYDYYERTPAVEDDDKSIEWNTTTRNVSAPDSKNQGHSYYIREGEYSKELIKLSLPIFSLLFNNVIMSIVL